MMQNVWADQHVGGIARRRISLKVSVQLWLYDERTNPAKRQIAAAF
jgi:hypothetical protein